MSTPGEAFFLQEAEARAFCTDLLGQLDVPPAEIAACTDVFVEASLRGTDSHGITLVATFAERIRSGQMRPGRSVLVRREGPATALVDGQHGLGPALARRAVALACGKAGRIGMGAVCLVDGNYIGALAPYLVPVARQGYFALAVANSTPRVAPHGGCAGLHGTNPIAWAAPVAGGEPLVFDAATGHAAARVQQAADEGRSLETGIALDAQGRPTTDAAAAAGGVLLPVGGALGYGLGLLVDVLSGGLADAAVGPQVPPVGALDGPYGATFFVWVVDGARFGGAEALARRCACLVAAAHAVPPAAGYDAVRLPGERARRCRQQRQAQGIPFLPRRWEAILARLVACDLQVARWRR